MRLFETETVISMEKKKNQKQELETENKLKYLF